MQLSQNVHINVVKVIKFIYSEKATKFCEISTLLLTRTTQDISKGEISHYFVAFSEYMNFKNPLFSIIFFQKPSEYETTTTTTTYTTTTYTTTTTTEYEPTTTYKVCSKLASLKGLKMEKPKLFGHKDVLTHSIRKNDHCLLGQNGIWANFSISGLKKLFLKFLHAPPFSIK